MATRVEFHTGVPDEVVFACRLLRKAYHAGARVCVRAEPATLARLDRELWTFVEREFVPHLRFAQPGALPPQAARTPIWLVDGEPPPDGPAVLVNLGADAPQALDGIERLIEIVSAEPDQAQRGRARWKAYRAQGLEVEHHDAGARGG
ncbi:MAG: DNA polymerase III subunit chi [Rubrivivax sp.]